MAVIAWVVQVERYSQMCSSEGHQRPVGLVYMHSCEDEADIREGI